jgi:type IV secretion/conjugal transfer VirB4 family ATPase
MGRKAKSFADLLPWGQLADSGLVFTKQGQLVTGYYFRPPDNESRTEEEADILSDQVNTALAALGSGWASWADVLSFPAGRYPHPSASHFPDEYSRAVDDERRVRFEAKGQHFENERAFLISYLPPRHQVSRLTDLFFTDGGGKRRATQQQVVETFNKMLREFENRIAGTLGLRRMQSFNVVDGAGYDGKQDELVNYLDYCATGRVRGVMLPRSGAFLDTLITGQDADLGENPVIGGEFIGVVSIDGFPAESQPNIIAALNTLALPYRFTQRMIYLDPLAAEKEITKYRDKWGQQIRGIAQKMMPTGDGPVNEHAVGMKAEANAAIAWAKSGDVKFGFYSATVIVRHADPTVLREWTDHIAQVISGCGFGARIEETNTIEAWLGSLSGETYSNVRRPPLHTKTAADLMPLSGVWAGDIEAPCPFYPPGSPALLWAVTDGAIPFRLNLHIGPRSDIGHTLILGPSSAGKSTLVNSIALQARRYQHMRITAFDNKRGMMATALACGGGHFDLASEANADGMFCPLGILETESDVEWAADYAAILYELQTKHEPDPELRNGIVQAVRDLAQSPKRLRSITNFASALQDTAARRVFQFYTINGGAGAFLDGVVDHGGADSDFSVYETQDLMSLGDVTALPVLLYQFRRFERSLDGRPALLFIAEAWQAFGHPMWRARLAKWLRLLRSKNCCVVMDTQSLADVVGSPILPLLNETAQRKIFLPNAAAMQGSGQSDNPGSYELYRSLGLNDRQIRQIQSGVPKRDYYVTGPDGCRMVSLGLGPLELAIAGATGEPDVLAVRAAVSRHGDDWLQHFLADKGIFYVPARTRKEMIYA